MILTNRLFERQEPNKEAKSIYIFCEGAKRGYQYFEYFKEMDSRVNIEVYKLHPHENNSPLGLLEIAEKSIVISAENPNPKYKFQENDEVWIILDIDKDKEESRKPQIEEVIRFCKDTNDWYLVQSNPCFEVCLYYHQFDEPIIFKGDDKCSNWKRVVNESIKGGFDSRRHPIVIERAIKNSKKHFKEKNNEPTKACTEVYKLGESMLSILNKKIENILKRLEI